MKRLKNNSCIIYDAQIIIYYCFLYKKHRILELTNKARKLTQFLIDNGVKIVIPEAIIIEIKDKGFEKIISEYTVSECPTQIIGLSKNISNAFKYRLQKKVEGNFNNMINSSWFEVRKYSPREALIDLIEYFFDNIGDKSLLKEFLTKKRRKDPVPSRTDMELMAFSKDIQTPIISNDSDFTFFKDELFEKNLSYKIYDFMDLDVYS